MKILSWNVAGIRACIKKLDFDKFSELDPDVICFQETKIDKENIAKFELFNERYPYRYWVVNNGESQPKGFNGVATLSKHQFTIIECPFDKEGRVAATDFGEFILVNLYVPNSQDKKSARFIFRTQYWDNELRDWIQELKNNKPVIICGDLNVCHGENDHYNFNKYRNKMASLYDDERDNFTKLLNLGFCDAFKREENNKNIYSFWSYRGKSRETNKGFRLDYFIVPPEIEMKIKSCNILTNIHGSDHCPIELQLNYN